MVQTWTPDDTIDIIRRIPLSEKNNLRKARRQNEVAFWTELESSIETERQHEVSATGPSDGSFPGQIVSFSSGTQQGFYNAALALRRNQRLRLWKETLPADPKAELKESEVREALEKEIVGLGLLGYGVPFEPSAPKPPVWISVVGNDAFWPITYRSFEDFPGSDSMRSLYDPNHDFIESLFPRNGPINKPESKEQVSPFREYNSLSYDRPSVALIFALILFALVNAAFYYLNLDWGPARCFDRIRLVKMPAEYLYLAACIVPLWMLLAITSLLACIPLHAEPLETPPDPLGKRPAMERSGSDRGVLPDARLAGGLGRHLLDVPLPHPPRAGGRGGEGQAPGRRQPTGPDRTRQGSAHSYGQDREIGHPLDLAPHPADRLLHRLRHLSSVDLRSRLGLTRQGHPRDHAGRGRLPGEREAPLRGDGASAPDRPFELRQEPLHQRPAADHHFPPGHRVPGDDALHADPAAELVRPSSGSRPDDPGGGRPAVDHPGSDRGCLLEERQCGRARRLSLVTLALLGSGIALHVVLWGLGLVIIWVWKEPHHFGHMLLVFERSTHLYSGVSLLTMALFLTLAVYAWGFTQLFRLYLFHYFYPRFDKAYRQSAQEPDSPVPAPDDETPHPADEPEPTTAVRWRRAELKKLRGTRKQLDHLLKRPTGTIVDQAGIWFALAALIAVTWMARFLMNTVPPFENPFLSLLMWIGLCLFLFLWVHWLIHVLLLVKFIRKILYQVRALADAVGLHPPAAIDHVADGAATLGAASPVVALPGARPVPGTDGEQL